VVRRSLRGHSTLAGGEGMGVFIPRAQPQSGESEQVTGFTCTGQVHKALSQAISAALHICVHDPPERVGFICI
jgi:hypothetical protein